MCGEQLPSRYWLLPFLNMPWTEDEKVVFTRCMSDLYRVAHSRVMDDDKLHMVAQLMNVWTRDENTALHTAYHQLKEDYAHLSKQYEREENYIEELEARNNLLTDILRRQLDTSPSVARDLLEEFNQVADYHDVELNLLEP